MTAGTQVRFAQHAPLGVELADSFEVLSTRERIHLGQPQILVFLRDDQARHYCADARNLVKL